jgi:hypothetical protein
MPGRPAPGPGLMAGPVRETLPAAGGGLKVGDALPRAKAADHSCTFAVRHPPDSEAHVHPRHVNQGARRCMMPTCKSVTLP